MRNLADHNILASNQLLLPDSIKFKKIKRARYYNPLSGRFLSEDPIDFVGGDFNLYRYVGNNPVILTDPSGQNPVLGAGLMIVGAAILSQTGTINSTPGKVANTVVGRGAMGVGLILLITGIAEAEAPTIDPNNQPMLTPNYKPEEFWKKISKAKEFDSSKKAMSCGGSK